MDPDKEALKRLLLRVPREQHARLRVQRAAAPAAWTSSSERFSAVHAGRVLHLLGPDALQLSLRKFFRWLYQEGRAFHQCLQSSGRVLGADVGGIPHGACGRKALADI